jgi:hypothetical protein
MAAWLSRHIEGSSSKTRLEHCLVCVYNLAVGCFFSTESMIINVASKMSREVAEAFECFKSDGYFDTEMIVPQKAWFSSC